MTWTEALEIVIAQTRHKRYRDLCADDNPDHAAWRQRMIEKATGQPALRPIDAILAEAKAEGVPKSIPRQNGCCNG